MTLEDLARDVLHVMELQRQYFREKSTLQLQLCKQKEAELKRNCERIVNPPDQPEMFS